MPAEVPELGRPVALKMSKTVDSSSLVPWAPVEVEDQVECQVENRIVDRCVGEENPAKENHASGRGAW